MISSPYPKIRKFLIHELASKIIPYMPVSAFRFPLPDYVIVEPTNICNLRCPLCPTNYDMQRTKGLMNMDHYRLIIEELATFVTRIAFNFSGEPTLHKELFDMVKLAEAKGVWTYISTNTTYLDKYIDQVFDSNLSMITVCLDGATKKAHEAYRVGSTFEKVKANITMLVKEKKRRKSVKPKIELQFLVMKHNEKEIPDVVEMARELGVDELSMKTISLGSSVGLKEKLSRAKRYLPENEKLSRYTQIDGKLRIKSQPVLCDWVKKSVIYWNGDVTTCCYDFNGKHTIGNIFDYGSFKKLWYSYAYAKTRKGVLTHQLPLCKTCTLPMDYGVVLTKEQLQFVDVKQLFVH